MANNVQQKQGSGGQIIKLALVLLAVAAVIALVLGFINSITEGPIKAYNDNKTAQAYANVMEGYNGDEAEVLYDVNDKEKAAEMEKVKAVIEPDGNSITKLVKAANGYVAETEFSGAQGMITMVIGLDNDLNCTGIYVTEHSETSGLGAKAAETSDGAWRDNLLGQGDGLNLKKNGGSVEAISGATITSTAVVKEVQTVIDAVKALG